MAQLTERLIAFMVFGVVAGAFILYRGLTTEGETQVVWTIRGSLTWGGVVVILLG